MARLPPASLAWLTWGLLASLYFVGFFQRVAPAVKVDELMRDFSIAATLLGNLCAVYFYTYAAIQIPSGLLVDAVGPRRVGAAAAVAAAIGIVLFAQAESLWRASLGRALIGASVAVAFVACMKLAGHWFPANRFATVTNYLFGILPGYYLRRPSFVRKTSATTRNNTAVLAADPQLTVTVEDLSANGFPPSGWYSLEAMFITTANALAGIKILLTLPSGTTTGNLASLTGQSTAWTPRDAFATGTVIDGTGTPVVSFLRGVIQLSGTLPPTITVQWAQNTAHASDASMGIGSYLMVQRLYPRGR